MKKENKIKPEEIRNVLIIRLGKIGDIIATSFVFEIIKDNNKNTNISLITKATNKEVLRCNPSLDKIYYIKSGLAGYFQLFRLRKTKYDLMMDFNDNPSNTTKFIFSNFKATIKCGYDFPLYHEFLDIRVPQLNKKESHILERMKYFLEYLGFRCNDKLVKPFLYTDPEIDKNKRFIQLKETGRKILALNISAGAKTRFWDTGNWINLIKNMFNYSSKYIILLLATEENKKEAEEIKTATDSEYIFIPDTKSFMEFASLIKCSDLLISPDTSAVHIASAFGKPVVALYPKSEWNFVSWQPFKVKCKSIQSSSENINSISPDEVFLNFKKLVEEIN